MLGLMGVRLDPVPHVLVVSGGRRISYDKLLIATGARARQLPFLRGYRNVHTVRTLFDVERLRPQLVPGRGSQSSGPASSARRSHPRRAAGRAGHDDRGSGDPPRGHSRRAGRPLVRRAASQRGRGDPDLGDARRRPRNGRVEELVLTDGRRIECDVVVVGVGVAPETGWLEGTGLTPDGIPVSVGGRTAIPDVFAAGDVAAVFEPRLGRQLRTEHWDSAARGGAAAARTMLGRGGGSGSAQLLERSVRPSNLIRGHAAIADDHRIEGDGSGRELTVVVPARGVTGRRTDGGPASPARGTSSADRAHSHKFDQPEMEKAA